MSDQRVWYKYEYHTGPGHQGTYRTYRCENRVLTDAELEESTYDAAYCEHLENWVCHPVVIDAPPQEYIDHLIEIAKARIKEGVDELRLHGCVSKAWTEFPVELRDHLTKLIDMHLSRIRSITHEHTETFTYAQVREWTRAACVLYLMDDRAGVK